MTEKIKLLYTNERLCLQFESVEYKTNFLNDMKAADIAMFTEEKGMHCYIKEYSPPEFSLGGFISEHGRLGLAFASEKLKFFFKERIGLDSECFMDMGRGYEEQIHFNERKLPPVNGASLTMYHETAEDQEHAQKCRPS